MAKPFYPHVKPGSYMANPRKGYIPFVGRGGYTKQNQMWNPEPDPIWESVTGNPVSFETIKQWPLRQLSVAFSPVQDLHGYDSPWPAGGGANKWDEEWEVGSIYDETGANNDNVDTLIRSKNYIPVSAETAYYAQLSNGNAHIFCYDSEKTYINYIDRVGSGTFTTLANTAYIRFRLNNAYGTTYNHDVAINYPSSVTTYAPYSNLCPILGWDSLTVEQRGKNLLHGTEYAGSFYNVNAGTSLVAYASEHASYTQSGNEITVNTITAFYGVLLATDVLPAGKYHVHCDSPTVTGSAVLRDSVFVTDKDLVTVGAAVRNWANLDPLDVTVTLTEPSRIAISLSANTSNTQTVYKNLQVELGESYTEWQAYNPRSISITIGQTVYSGYVDVVTGVGEIDKAIIDMGEMRWTLNYDLETWQDFRSSDINSVVVKPATDKTDPNMECSCFKPVYRRAQSVDGQINTIGLSSGGNVVVLVTAGAYADATAFKTAMTGQKICYPLATPIPIQLTPQEVESLAGDNTMWTDGDSLEVTYRSN